MNQPPIRDEVIARCDGLCYAYPGGGAVMLLNDADARRAELLPLSRRVLKFTLPSGDLVLHEIPAAEAAKRLRAFP